MTGRAPMSSADRLLTVEAAAERMSTSVRFIRRLIAERRIEFVKVGRHVRISESALADFIDAGRVEPLTRRTISAQDERSRVMAEQGRSSTFRQRPADCVRPVPDPLPRTGWADAHRPGDLRAQGRR